MRIPPIPATEIECTAIRAQGAGGQNVNKVSSAIHLRFDIHASSLPDPIKQRLLKLPDQRISNDGVIVIKAQSQRTQEQNKKAAMLRLRQMIESVAIAPRMRRPTRPTRSSQLVRLDIKNLRGQQKKLRRKVD